MRYAFRLPYHIGTITLSIKVIEVLSMSLIFQIFTTSYAVCIDL
jgi:hypothetical protein